LSALDGALFEPCTKLGSVLIIGDRFTGRSLGSTAFYGAEFRGRSRGFSGMGLSVRCFQFRGDMETEYRTRL
jgi:hypothetical protein